jgi:peptidoglycan/xylan/chitin deacetylase (PgdA/CDA1 family)
MLKKHYTILPLNELYLSENPLSKLKKACFITFDDGYKDFLDYAYPILKKQRVFSTLFVLPYQITNKGHIWTATIIFFTKHYSFDEIDEFLKSHGVNVKYRNKNNAFRLNLDITICLCDMKHDRRMIIINSLREKFVIDKRVIENELLSFDELRLLDPVLVDVESHSLTHPGFKNETNIEFIETELSESKRIIETELSTAVNAFAFPFANYNQMSIDIARKIYKVAFTGINDFVSLEKLKKDSTYKYNLPRFNIHQDSAEEVFFVINGFHRRLLK